MIQDLAEIECMIHKYKINPAVIWEYYIGWDVGFALSVVCDLQFPLTKVFENQMFSPDLAFIAVVKY